MIKNWDDFWIPFPFNEAWVVFGNPIFVSENDDLKAKALELKAELDRITLEADANAKK